MIIDRLEFADRYVSMHPQFGAAFRFLRQLNAQELPAGRVEIDGDGLFAINEQTLGRGAGATRIEHHRRYIDIQYVVSGEETIGWRDTATCSEPDGNFDSSRDVGFFLDPPLFSAKIPAGCFAIFLPEDGHAPLQGTEAVHKVVIKGRQWRASLLQSHGDQNLDRIGSTSF